jgi:hypothetical protein
VQQLCQHRHGTLNDQQANMQPLHNRRCLTKVYTLTVSGCEATGEA